MQVNSDHCTFILLFDLRLKIDFFNIYGTFSQFTDPCKKSKPRIKLEIRINKNIRHFNNLLSLNFNHMNIYNLFYWN